MIKHRAWDHYEKKMYDHVNVLVDKNGLLKTIEIKEVWGE